MTVRYLDELTELEKLSLIEMSYSRLSTFDSCQAQYFHTYIMGEPRGWGEHAALGSTIHSVLEHVDYDQPLDLTKMQELFVTYREQHDPEHNISDNLLQAGQEIMSTFVERHQDDEWHILGKEMPFAIVVGSALIVGYIDRVDKIGNVIHYTDYKCLTLDTLIQMSDGSQKRARDIEVGDRVVGYRDGLHVPTTVTDIFDNGIKPIVEIVTAQGRRLSVTRNHPVLTSGGWVQAGGLKPGHKLVSEVSFGYDWWEGTPTITPEDAYLLGAMCGDGSTSSGIKFSNRDKEVVDRMNVCLKPHNARLIEYGDGHRGNFDIRQIDYTPSGNRGSLFRRFLSKHGILGHTALTKRAPQAVMTGGPDVWREFLTGIFDTDGHIRINPSANVVINMTNEGLLKDCQHLLAYLGIKSTLYQIDTSYKESPYTTWRLKITDAFGVRRFANVIASNVPHKAARLISLSNEDSYGRDVIYTPEYVYDTVVSVTAMGYQGMAPTLGITVDGNHTHVTEGIVTHNSGRREVTYKDAPTNLQLGIYALAMAKAYPGHRIIGDLYYLRSGRMKGHEYTAGDLLAVENRVIDAVNKLINTFDFHYTQNKSFCHWCEHAKSGACEVGAKRIRY